MTTEREAIWLQRAIVVAFFILCLLVASMWGPLLTASEGGLEISGPLSTCSSDGTPGCYHINGGIYIQLSPELRRTAEITDRLIGREVVLSIQPKVTK